MVTRGVMSTRWLPFICLAALCFLPVSSSPNSDSATLSPVTEENLFQKVYHESFPAPRGTEVYLDADGRVELEVWDKPEVDVRVDYHVKERFLWKKSRSGDRGYGVEMYKRGNRIVIKAKRPRIVAFGYYRVQRDIDYQLKVPSYVKLDIYGEDDPLSIRGVQGVVEVSSEDGEIRLYEVNSPHIRLQSDDGDIFLQEVVSTGSLSIRGEDGDIEIYDTQAQEFSVRTDDGDIALYHVDGDILVHTNDGRINLSEVDTSHLEIEGEDGSVRVETTIYPGGNYRIRTEDGDIYLTIPNNCSAKFDATTDDGSFHIDLPIKADRVSRGHLRGSLGKGEATIRLWTLDGDITINAR